jgi:hypothetical protein
VLLEFTGEGETVAVNVTPWPRTKGLPDDISVVVGATKANRVQAYMSIGIM